MRLGRTYGDPELERRGRAVVDQVGPLLARAPQGFGHLLGSGAACYAALNIVLAIRTPRNAGTFVVTCGMFAAGSVVMLPVVLITDSFVPLGWPLPAPSLAAVGLGIISATCYCLYIYLVDQAGPVFTSQTANVVTLAGVAWGILIFGDTHSFWIWLSLVTIMIGLALVRPRTKKPRDDAPVNAV